MIIAYPVFSAWAMKSVPASHGAVVNGLQPLFVALYAAWLSHERPSKAFWASAVAGSALVIAFALRDGGGTLQAGDALMLVAVGIGALGYAEGARLARQIGGWQVICWALVVSAPFLVLPVGWLAWMQHAAHPGPLAPRTWLAFGYVTLFRNSSAFSPGMRGSRWGHRTCRPGAAAADFLHDRLFRPAVRRDRHAVDVAVRGGRDRHRGARAPLGGGHGPASRSRRLMRCAIMFVLPDRFCPPGREGSIALAPAHPAVSKRFARTTFLD